MDEEDEEKEESTVAEALKLDSHMDGGDFSREIGARRRRGFGWEGSLNSMVRSRNIPEERPSRQPKEAVLQMKILLITVTIADVS